MTDCTVQMAGAQIIGGLDISTSIMTYGMIAGVELLSSRPRRASIRLSRTSNGIHVLHVDFYGQKEPETSMP